MILRCEDPSFYCAASIKSVYSTKPLPWEPDVETNLALRSANHLKVRFIQQSHRGTEYCGKVEQHDYQLYLAINDIEHTKTKNLSQ